MEEFFEDLPVGAQYTDSIGSTWMKIEEVKINIRGYLFTRNCVVILSPYKDVHPGYLGYVTARLKGEKVLVTNVVLPSAHTAR